MVSLSTPLRPGLKRLLGLSELRVRCRPLDPCALCAFLISMNSALWSGQHVRGRPIGSYPLSVSSLSHQHEHGTLKGWVRRKKNFAFNIEMLGLPHFFAGLILASIVASLVYDTG